MSCTQCTHLIQETKTDREIRQIESWTDREIRRQRRRVGDGERVITANRKRDRQIDR